MLCIFIYILQNVVLICKCTTSFKRNASHAAFDLPQYHLGNIRRCRAKLGDCCRRVKIHDRYEILFFKVFPRGKPKTSHDHIGGAFLQHFLKPYGDIKLVIFFQIASGKGLQKRTLVICAVILDCIMNHPVQLIGKRQLRILFNLTESVREFFQNPIFLFLSKLPERKRNITPRMGI